MNIHTIAAFVTARLDDIEHDAKQAIGTAAFRRQTGRWLHLDVPDQHGSRLVVFAVAVGPEGEARTQVADLTAAWEGPKRAAHIARHDPARVLAEVSAQRTIVANMCSLHEAAWQYEDARTDIEYLTLTTVRRLAALDADHPDYDHAWTLKEKS